MNNKIVLFFPKLEPYKDYHYFPLSLLSIIAPLVNQGIECKIIDERVNENYEQELMKELPDAFCFCTTAFTGYQLYRAFEVTKKVRQNFPQLKIIWGGQHIINLPEQTLSSEYIDIGVVGYGEHIFKELINRLLAGKEYYDLAGVVYKDSSGKVIFNPPPLEFETENLPCLPYWLVDINKYINPKTKRFIYVSSYGCPGVCTFCATNNQKRWKLLPLNRFRTDVDYLVGKYKFEEVAFFDATIFTLPLRLLEMLDYLRKYEIKSIVYGRAVEMYHLKDEFFEKLMKVGLKSVTVGLETGSQKVVEIMKKGPRHLEFYEQMARKLKRVNLTLFSGLVFGLPGETPKELKETIRYIKKIKKINPNFRLSSTFFRPLPGTDLYFQLIKDGYIFPDTLEDWAKKGEQTHYLYNQFMDIPWMTEECKKEYREIYNHFREEEKDLFA